MRFFFFCLLCQGANKVFQVIIILLVKKFESSGALAPLPPYSVPFVIVSVRVLSTAINNYPAKKKKKSSLTIEKISKKTSPLYWFQDRASFRWTGTIYIYIYIYIYKLGSSFTWCNFTKVTHFLDSRFLKDLMVKKKNY